MNILDKILCLFGCHNWWENAEKGYWYCTNCGKRKYYIKKEEK